MKRGNRRLIFGVGGILVYLFAGCKTAPAPAAAPPPPPPPPPQIVEVMSPPPPPEIIEIAVPLQPLTRDMVNQIGAEAVPAFQYYISGQVILLKERSELRSRNTGKALELINAYTRDIITIDGITKGEVIGVGTNSEGKITLDACFESDSELTLRFVQSGEGYFDLEIHDGMVIYGGMQYRALPAEQTTRLLINLESRSDVQDFNRYASGRSIEETYYEYGDMTLDKREPPLEELPPADSPPVETAYGRYRVQVGSYASMDNAQDAFDRLVAAGFNPAYEQHGGYHRVILSGVSAGEIDDLIRRLDSAGFSAPWIREEY